MSSTALAPTPNGITSEFLGDQQIELIRHSLGMQNASALEFDLFINLCKAKRLDPLTKQMYAVSYKGKWQFFASIDGLRVIAERSGNYGGQTEPYWCGPDGIWKDAWLEDGAPAAAKVGVYKRGFAHPTWGVATFKSYGTGKTNNWLSMPDVMLAKCAESIALRKAFPDDLSGLYVREEFEDQSPAPSRSRPMPDRLAISEDFRTATLLTEDGRVIDADTGEIENTQGALIPEAETAPIDRITQDQITRMTALRNGLNWHSKDINEAAGKITGISNPGLLTEAQAEELLGHMEMMLDAALREGLDDD